MKMWQAAKISRETGLMCHMPGGTTILGIPVEVALENEYVVIVDYKIDMYGVGDTLRDAVYDYCTMVIQFYADLLLSKDSLGDALRRNMEYIKSTIYDTGNWTDQYIIGWVRDMLASMTTATNFQEIVESIYGTQTKDSN